MKVSRFNIVNKLDDNILLYNTFSTSLVELEPAIYNGIFVDHKFSDYAETKELYRMGYLINDDFDELALMEELRQDVINNSGDKIANIIIAPTLECNAHCFYCFEKGFRKGIMSRETADKLIDFLAMNWNGDKLGITWFGGEPLLGRDIIDYIVDGLIKNNISYASKITTNGSLLNEYTINLIKKKWNVDKIQVTIDAVGDEYNRIKCYDSSIDNPFSIVMENIELALKEGLKIKIRINFDPEKQDIALDTFNYLTNQFKGSKHIKIYFAPIDEDNEQVKNISNCFDGYKEHPYISLIKFGRKNGLYRGFPDMEDTEDETESLADKGLLKKLKIYPSVTNCYASCPNVYSIDPSGRIYKCHRVLGQEKFASGDIFSGIEKNDAYQFFCNTNMTYEECKKCAILPICQGGCKVNAKLYSGTAACAPSKAIINDLILLYKQDLDKLLKGGSQYEDS